MTNRKKMAFISHDTQNFHFSNLKEKIPLEKMSPSEGVVETDGVSLYLVVCKKNSNETAVYKREGNKDIKLFSLPYENYGALALHFSRKNIFFASGRNLFLFNGKKLLPRLKLPEGGLVKCWSFASDKDGYIYLGIYGDYEPGATIYRSNDEGKTWRIIFQKSRKDGYRHIHRVCVDSYTGVLWATHGDRNRGAVFSADKGGTWKDLAFTCHDAATSMVFTERYVYFGADYTASVYRYDKVEHILEAVFELHKRLGGSCYDMAYYDGVIYATFVSYGKPFNAMTAASIDGLNWFEIESIPNKRKNKKAGYSRIIGFNNYVYFSRPHIIRINAIKLKKKIESLTGR